MMVVRTAYFTMKYFACRVWFLVRGSGCGGGGSAADAAGAAGTAGAGACTQHQTFASPAMGQVVLPTSGSGVTSHPVANRVNVE